MLRVSRIAAAVGLTTLIFGAGLAGGGAASAASAASAATITSASVPCGSLIGLDATAGEVQPKVTKTGCDAYYNLLIKSCQTRWGNYTTRLAICYIQAAEDYADCLKDATGESLTPAEIQGLVKEAEVRNRVR